jgi:hypothetical protein
MEDFWDIAIPIAGLIGSIGLAIVLLSRARSHAKLETPEKVPTVPSTASRRQRRVLEKLDPVPELPTLMDLVRQEIADLGIKEIPGHDGISETVLLKVYRRDHIATGACDHDALHYVLADGVAADEAGEDSVTLVCDECEVPGTIPNE